MPQEVKSSWTVWIFLPQIYIINIAIPASHCVCWRDLWWKSGVRLPYLNWRFFYDRYIVSPYSHYKLSGGRLLMIWFDVSFTEFCQNGLSNYDGSATLSGEWHSSLLTISNLDHVLNTTVQWAHLLYDAGLEQVRALWPPHSLHA